MIIRTLLFTSLLVAAKPPQDLLQEIDRLEEKTFADEKEARRFENEGFVPLWDKLLATPRGQRMGVMAKLPLETITLGKINREIKQDLGIQLGELIPGGPKLTPTQWQAWVTRFQGNGLEITHTDWHHDAFRRDENGQAISDIRFTIHLERNKGLDRTELKAVVEVIWQETETKISAKTITLKSGRLARRVGPKAFVPVAVIEGQTDKPDQRDDMGAISVYDLNGDQLPEIILGNANRIFWNKGDMKFEAAPLIPKGGLVHSSVMGIVGDFNGDGRLDWLCDSAKARLMLYPGTDDGTFAPQPKEIALEIPLRVPSCLTAGDIDRDGDLDLFTGQWRSLYEKMPAEFWNANDGYGNTLLLNDGKGNFTDATATRGLGTKRFRRTYSASFVDIDQDLDLDLIVVSDFYGLDVFKNDGKGHFSDATGELVKQPHSFGMSHTMADYNGDGITDLFMLGMGSTTARRLEKMKAHPDILSGAKTMRSIMGYGNRFYLGSKNGVLAEPEFINQVARTGWAWGSTSFDFDNDGDQDIYVGNGHISGKSTRDYCSNFWCRDIYLLRDKKAPVISSYLNSLTTLNTESWDGYQVNSLLVNQSGNGFSSSSHMLDVGFDFDTRRILSADLDLDGRPDLLVGRQESTSGFFHDAKSETQPPALLVLKNTLPEASQRNWITVSLQGKPGISPHGAVVELKTQKSSQRAVVISGDSFMCQHPAQKHFGMGTGDEVIEIKVIWPNGGETVLKEPELNLVHAVRP
jgi:hypothetical protein